MTRSTSYKLLTCIGRGGFGEVYLALVQRPGGLERRRALKLLRSDLMHVDEALSRLRDEGRMLAMLEHPAIVQVEDIVRIDGCVGLVMEYVEGSDLRNCLKARLPIPESVALEIIATVADALASAVELHSPQTGRPLRLVHRDIKPGNIMISSFGRVKLLDFGVARSREIERDTNTRVGEVPMTPGFTAPEVLLSQQQGPSGDVYALGVTLFRTLIRQDLFEKRKLTQQIVLMGEPVHYHKWLDDRLTIVRHKPTRQLLSDMLRWDPNQRPASHLVRERAETILSRLQGPRLSQWARRTDLPASTDITDAPLVGRVVFEDEGPGELSRATPATAPIPNRHPRPLTGAPAGLSASGVGAISPLGDDTAPRNVQPSASRAATPLRYAQTILPVEEEADTLRPEPESPLTPASIEASPAPSSPRASRMSQVALSIGLGVLIAGCMALLGVVVWAWSMG
ncbi:MAG: protein kinase [Myxococcota bacterium]